MSSSVSESQSQLCLFPREAVRGSPFLRGDLDPGEFITANIGAVSHYQASMLAAILRQFSRPKKFTRNPDSDLVTDDLLVIFGDELRKHHATSRQPLSKDKFEFALESACIHSGRVASLSENRTLAGADITIDGQRYSLKTESAKNIRLDELLISKYMELGKGRWDYDYQRSLFFAHLDRYERILQFRCIQCGPRQYVYELVEIPKDLLIESKNFDFEVVFQKDPAERLRPSEEALRSASCRILDQRGEQKFSLYFDGKGERKLSIKNIQKRHCVHHATWWFESDVF